MGENPYFPTPRCPYFEPESIAVSVIDLLFYIYFGIMGVGLLVMLVLIPLWATLHHILPSKLDPILFQRPFFKSSELLNYRVFPLSLFRSLNYVYLIALPTFAKKKRFKGFNEPLPVGLSTIIMCKLHAALCILLFLMGVPYLLISIWGLFAL